MTFYDLKTVIAALEADVRVEDHTLVVVEIVTPRSDEEPLASARVDDHPRRIVLSDR